MPVVPYDYAVSPSVFRTFCARYGLEVPEESALDLTGFFEGFGCPDGSDRKTNDDGRSIGR